jgi:hypothetical protein
MLEAVVSALRFIILVLAGHKQVALENVALRQQLAILKRERPRPKLFHGDRPFWLLLMKIWKEWRTALVIVEPATVVSWQRRRFKRYWWTLSQRNGPGRPQVSAEIRALIRKMANANPLWGAPRIHGELLKLGFEISERTVSRLIPKQRKEPSQTWKTFLTNHVSHWKCSPRMSQSHDRLRRAASEVDFEEILPVLPGFENSLVPGKGCAESRTIQSAETGNIVQIPKVGGLHHRYERVA